MTQNFLGKKYILKKSENFDAYMKELGVGLSLRKMGNTVSSTSTLLKNDDATYTFSLETPYRCSSIKFELDKEFEELTLDSRVVRTVCHLDGNIFIQEQSAPGLKSTTIVREYQDDKLVTTLIVGNVIAVRCYAVLKENEVNFVDLLAIDDKSDSK